MMRRILDLYDEWHRRRPIQADIVESCLAGVALGVIAVAFAWYCVSTWLVS